MEGGWQRAYGSVACNINTAEFSGEKWEPQNKHLWRAEGLLSKCNTGSPQLAWYLSNLQNNALSMQLHFY